MTMISENRAMQILCREGDYSEKQAGIILGHALKKPGPLFDSVYIYQRARENRRGDSK